ncbi:WXG100-like domain-containing protein [Saccharothrix variisporea]|uniref:WXG100 family type VII secretion target n=1 Tax=Saccharothrix variisporea TaxID=543527 RepID=A0A495XCQ7_9PSEU|nr:hypothetical protein [Saccharothrix variisporea]RKT69328.1 hypothetical protein DFJ66_2540 [Saccharothrix variisporea]
MNNPFIAQPKDDTTPITGIGLLEAGQAALDGINNGDWVEAGLGVVGVGLEALGVYMDPVGTLASYGVGWLIEHVQPLQDMLNDLAGTPPVIRAYAQTWQNVSEGVERAAGELETTSRDRTAGWLGAAGEAYRARAAEVVDALRGAAKVCSGVGAVVTVMGELVAAVREFVRDLIADAVGRLVVWGLELLVTGGAAAPVVAMQATSLVAKYAAKIADILRKLLKTISNVAKRLDGLAEVLRLVWRKLKELVERLRRKDPDPQRKNPREVERQRKEREKRELIEEAQRDGVKLDPDKVVEIGKDPNGKIVFLEEGGVNPRTGKEAGLAHVMKHKDEFVAGGIPEDKIAEVVHRAATEGRYTGYCQGKPPGRPIFEVEYGGQKHYVSVSVGNNGYIVGANMRSADSPFDGARRDPRAETDPNYRGWGR